MVPMHQNYTLGKSAVYQCILEECVDNLQIILVYSLGTYQRKGVEKEDLANEMRRHLFVYVHCTAAN